MRLFLSILPVILLFPPFWGDGRGSAQMSLPDMGIFGGVSFYMGDLNPSSPFKQSHPAGGIVVRTNFGYFLSVKNTFLYGTISGDDAGSKDPVKKERNLHFRSPLFEFSTQVEFNFFPYKNKKEYYLVSPYLFSGISVFHFNPQAKFGSDWYDLHPLSTEGQGTIAYPDKTKYSLTQLSIPIGMGLKYDLNQNITIAIEWGMRKTFTDYIDDVSGIYPDPDAILAEKSRVAGSLSNRASGNSGVVNTKRQRGNSAARDWYAYAGLIITANKKERDACPKF